MSTDALAVTSVGMVTGVGLSAASSCAAIRCAVDNFQETRFRDRDGEWLLGSATPLPQPWRGETKLVKMLAQAVRECIEGRKVSLSASPVLLCLAEAERHGRSVTNDDEFFEELRQELGAPLHPRSAVIQRGHVGAAVAIHQARALLADAQIESVLVASVDSLLVSTALTYFEEKQRLLTSKNSDGFIPGDAAATFLLERSSSVQGPRLVCRGIGFAVEKAHIDSDDPFRADGLTQAIKAALTDAGCEEKVLKFKIIDVAGSQYQFKESSLAFTRIDRTKRTEFDVWHPADCIGEVGAAIGPVMVGVLKAAYEKGYAKGDHVLMHLGNDDGKRAALIFGWQES